MFHIRNHYPYKEGAHCKHFSPTEGTFPDIYSFGDRTKNAKFAAQLISNMRVMKGHIGQIVFLRFCILCVQFFVLDIVSEIIR